jgi:hypothetical protein
MAKLSQRRTSKKQKVLQRPNPCVSKTFVSVGLLAGAPALETDVDKVWLGCTLRRLAKLDPTDLIIDNLGQFF